MQTGAQQKFFNVIVWLQVPLILAAITVYAYVWTGIKPLLQQREAVKTEIEGLRKQKDALISSIGALNYAKVTSQNQVFQLKVSAIALTGQKTPDGKPVYRFSAYVDAPPDTLQNITKVTYDFSHPTFLKPHREETNRENKFQTQYIGWGCLTEVDVTMYFKDGTTQSIPFDMCKALGPEWGQS
jgi:hypothetical protein